jgi:hypothetical protein
VKPSPALLALALLLPLGGCPLLQIEAEVPEVCISRTDVDVPGSLGQIETHVTVKLADIEALDEIKAGDELHFTSFSARPQGGGRELSGIQSAKVTLRGGGMSPLVIFDCDGDCAAADGSISLTLSAEDNIAAYLQADDAAVEIELHGTLPLRDFKVDVNACLSAEVSRSL